MENEPDIVLNPPSARRVAQRALVLAAMVCRGAIEQDAGNSEADRFRFKVLDWLKTCEAESELEPSERELMMVPLGKLSPEQHAGATWRAEGMVVLAWALYRTAIPRYYDFAQSKAVANTLGWLTPEGGNLVTTGKLRPKADLDTLSDRLFALHWRLANYSLDHRPMNFRKFAQEAWFGPLDVVGLEFVNDDLGLGGWPISDVPEQNFVTQYRLTEERRRAAEWLIGSGETYSEVDLST